MTNESRDDVLDRIAKQPNKLVEFPSGHTLDIIRERVPKYVRYAGDPRPRFCEHKSLGIDERRGMVTCKHCGDEMSPLEALKVLARRIWWEENQRERDMEHEIKRVSRIQREAFECLFRAGVTPEKYAERLKAHNEAANTGRNNVAESTT